MRMIPPHVAGSRVIPRQSCLSLSSFQLLHHAAVLIIVTVLLQASVPSSPSQSGILPVDAATSSSGSSQVRSLLSWLTSKATKGYKGGSFQNFHRVLSEYGELRTLLARTIDCEPGSRFTVFVPYNVKGDSLLRWTTRSQNIIARNTILAHFYDSRITPTFIRQLPVGASVDRSLGEAATLFRASNVTIRVNGKKSSYLGIRTRTPAKTWSVTSALRHYNAFQSTHITVHVITERLRSNVTRFIDISSGIPSCR